jgi:hypothetical protein
MLVLPKGGICEIRCWKCLTQQSFYTKIQDDLLRYSTTNKIIVSKILEAAVLY